jgi:hypothetical protein
MQESEEVRTVALQGASADMRAELISTSGTRALMTVENMPDVPQNKTLEIWVIKNNVPPSRAGSSTRARTP